jgi:prepilin-type N-terminal cleavage/methylation domain-containing protein
MFKPESFAKNTNALGGFTIIELLVVMSIIGMLSAVVFTALQGARDKGRIASSQQFSANLFHSWGADAIGHWRFDETTGSPAADDAPTAKAIVLNDVGTVPRSASTIYSMGNVVDFSGVVQASETTKTLNSGDISSKGISLGGGYTASVWVYYPTTSSSGWVLAAVNSSCVPVMYMNSSSGSSRNMSAGPFGVAAITNFQITAGKWYNYAFTYNPSVQVDKAAFYIDGKRYGTQQNVNAAILSGNYDITKIVVGAWPSLGGSCGSDTTIQLGSHFTGMMDDLAIYTNVLTASQIQEIYAQSAPKYIALNSRSDLEK